MDTVKSLWLTASLWLTFVFVSVITRYFSYKYQYRPAIVKRLVQQSHIHSIEPSQMSRLDSLLLRDTLLIRPQSGTAFLWGLALFSVAMAHFKTEGEGGAWTFSFVLFLSIPIGLITVRDLMLIYRGLVYFRNKKSVEHPWLVTVEQSILREAAKEISRHWRVQRYGSPELPTNTRSGFSSSPPRPSSLAAASSSAYIINSPAFMDDSPPSYGDVVDCA